VEIWRLRYVPGLDLRGGPPAAPLTRDKTVSPGIFLGVVPLTIMMSVAVAVIAVIAVNTLHVTRLHGL